MASEKLEGGIYKMISKISDKHSKYTPFALTFGAVILGILIFSGIYQLFIFKQNSLAYACFGMALIQGIIVYKQTYYLSKIIEQAYKKE